jgi:hypothetical protein
MEDDIRCCGTGTCLINAEGSCWCGQHWDGTQMCFAPKSVVAEPPKPLDKTGEKKRLDELPSV